MCEMSIFITNLRNLGTEVLSHLGTEIMCMQKLCMAFQNSNIPIDLVQTDKKKSSKVRIITDLFCENPLVTVDFPHKWPIMWKGFPCHGVIRMR